MTNFFPQLFKAASKAEVLPVSKERSDEPFESPVFEDYLAKQDIAGYMKALWKGVPARDAESMRVLFYLSVCAEEPDNAIDILDMLMDMEDEYALAFWYFFDPLYMDMEENNRQDLDELQQAFNSSLLQGDTAYKKLYPEFKSLFTRFGDHEVTLLKAYINNVGREIESEMSETVQQGGYKDCAPQEKKDEWKTYYHRDDCSSTQKSIYDDAIGYAQQGDPYAMYIVGYLLKHGIRTKYSNPNVTILESDPERALPWLKRAADADIIEACFETASVLFNHKDDPKAEDLAWRYMEKGAEHNNLNCLNSLFLHYKDKDDHKAFSYLERMAEQGRTHEYKLELAKWYEQGRGCEKNEKKAYELADYVYHHSSATPYDDSYDKAVDLLSHYLREGIGCEPDLERAVDIRAARDSDWDDLMDLLSR